MYGLQDSENFPHRKRKYSLNDKTTISGGFKR
jgi:hypothetical protein